MIHTHIHRHVDTYIYLTWARARSGPGPGAAAVGGGRWPPEAAHPFVEAAGGRLLDFPCVSVYFGFRGRVYIYKNAYNFWEPCPGIICSFLYAL